MARLETLTSPFERDGFSTWSSLDLNALIYPLPQGCRMTSCRFLDVKRLSFAYGAHEMISLPLARD